MRPRRKEQVPITWLQSEQCKHAVDEGRSFGGDECTFQGPTRPIDFGHEVNLNENQLNKLTKANPGGTNDRNCNVVLLQLQFAHFHLSLSLKVRNYFCGFASPFPWPKSWSVIGHWTFPSRLNWPLFFLLRLRPLVARTAREMALIARQLKIHVKTWCTSARTSWVSPFWKIYFFRGIT